MGNVGKLAQTLLLWTAAISSLFAGVPRLGCACPAPRVEVPSPANPCCCCTPTDSAEEEPCCCKRSPIIPSDPVGCRVCSPDCQRSLANGGLVTVKSEQADERASAGFGKAIPVLGTRFPTDVSHSAAWRLLGPGPDLPPPDDLLILLQRWTI